MTVRIASQLGVSSKSRAAKLHLRDLVRPSLKATLATVRRVARRLLLLSNSFVPKKGLLEHALDAIEEILDGRRRVLFIPFASSFPDEYTLAMSDALAPIGCQVHRAHRDQDVKGAIVDAEAIFVGGGNSFRLLKALCADDALDTLRTTAGKGTPYLAASAGSNLACPTIRTTNDMPIVEPPSLVGLSLVPFQINAHYVDPDPLNSVRMESRQRRIEEFLEENDVPVLGLREGSWIRVINETATLSGGTNARLFRRGTSPVEVSSGVDLSWLLSTTPLFDV